MVELLKVIFKDEKRTVGHSVSLRTYVIEGECKVGDVVFANLELGKTAKMIRVVTEVLPNDEFTTEYLVELDTMEDAVLVDTLDVGTTFTNRTTNWKGVIAYEDGKKVLKVYGGMFKKDLKATHLISEDAPCVFVVDDLNREGYDLYMLTVDGKKTHISEIEDRSVDVAMLDTMRMNSYVQNVLPEKLTTEALIERAVHLKSMCGYTSALAATYEESVVHVMVPELLVRLKELNDRVKELENRTNG